MCKQQATSVCCPCACLRVPFVCWLHGFQGDSEGRMYGGQGIEDVEDTKDGVAMHFQELSDLCEKVRANVDAIHVCKCYYMSHAYREVRL